jgi:hypothetical protein
MAVSQSFHGLEAYSGKRQGVHALLAKARALHGLADQAEICTADRPIGQIGVVVDAVHTFAFDCDVWSETLGRKAGQRTYGRRRPEFEMSDENGLTNDQLRLVGEAAAARGQKYAEYWASSPEVRCVWVADTASQRTQKRARVLARALGTVVVTVTETTPIAAYQAD